MRTRLSSENKTWPLFLAEFLFGLHRLSRSVKAIWCQNRDISRCEPSQSLHVVEAKVNRSRQKTHEWKRAKIEDMPAPIEQDGGSPGVGTGAVQQPHVEQVPAFEEGVRPIANFQVSPSDKFSFRPEDWLRWIQRFERFRKATGLDKRSGENQVNTLIYTMGEQADDVFISFEPGR